ncbi:hypothetical protein ISN45_Aa08g003770 [Arabidopsis thaliana x Arabidopsis arenosa]|uniref:Uncharacterized protein n=1 Tax=Arabidopsis thaliana x Arabidopsis arenosa TaxID=1240361 RepID=A0A8T1XEQ2_9BRAS|nr:hypothetical protein ISN45_Aa08g003770 [Arabidopsis thaliana x Arabidopsis arenosa]
MASIEMASRDRNKKEKNLKVFVGDRFNSCRGFPVDDSGSNEDGKRKDVLECFSRSSVFETGESLQIPSSYPLETNSNPFYNPGQPETSSRNGVIMGAIQIWEARSQQSSSSLSQSLIDSRTSSGLSLSDISNSSSFSEFLNDKARKNNESSGEEIDSDMSNVSNSYENDGEGRCFLELASCSTPRIRGRQANEDVCKMILGNRENELEWLVGRYAVSKFSPRGCGRLQYMLRIRSLERCIGIQERYRWNMRDRYRTNTEKGSGSNSNSAVETNNLSRLVSFRVENGLQETMETSNTMENQDAAYKPEIANKPVLTEAASNENGSKKPEIERKAIVKEGEETNKSSSSIAEKVNLWDPKERVDRRRTMGKAKDEGKDARRVIDVKTIGRNDEMRKKEEVSIFQEGKTMEIEEYRSNPQEVTSMVCLDSRKEEETVSHILRECGKDDIFSQNDEDTSKAEKQEASEPLCLILESPIYLNDWDENETEYEESEDYNGESMYHDWISDISRPRSYWEDLKKERELEVMNKNSEKDDMWNLIKWRTVSSFLEGGFREKIDKIMISYMQKRLEVESNLVEEEEEDNEESLVDCSARYQENLEENETEKENLEPVTVNRVACW